MLFHIVLKVLVRVIRQEKTNQRDTNFKGRSQNTIHLSQNDNKQWRVKQPLFADDMIFYIGEEKYYWNTELGYVAHCTSQHTHTLSFIYTDNFVAEKEL